MQSVFSTLGNPVCIAEIGLNHNGNLDTALQLINAARDAGVDAVKFQTFKALEFCGDGKLKYEYLSNGIVIKESMLDMFKRYELNAEEFKKVKRHCDKLNIVFLSTPQNYTDFIFLKSIGCETFKFGSDDFTNIPLLTKVSKHSVKVILSCGMASMSEIYDTMEIFAFGEKYPTALMLCTSLYPAPHETLHISRLKTLSYLFPKIELGYSDHSIGPLAGVIASSLGANIFEKHFTLNKNMQGPDHHFSAEPVEMREWVNSIKLSKVILGNHNFRPSLEEMKMKNIARRKILTVCEIKKGETFTDVNLALHRNKNGLEASAFNYFVGKKSNKDISKFTPLSYSDVD